MQHPSVEFDVRTPATDQVLAAHVASALGRGLLSVERGPERRDRLTLVANGPSARFAPQAGATLAVNNSLALFRTPPTFWAGCDPQESMASFLQAPPEETTYLVASKCHPAVFEALKHRRVLVWHVSDCLDVPDPIPCAVSITIVSLLLMERLGFRAFDTWGWDGCYMDGLDHAAPQRHAGDNITVHVGDREFATTTTWALEAQDAIHALVDFEHPICIHGGGMVGEILAAFLPGVSTPDFSAAA
jgi:hypothetical protein